MQNITIAEQLKFTHLPVISVTAENLRGTKGAIPIRDQAERLAVGCITNGVMVHENGHRWRGQRTTWPSGVTAISYGINESTWGEIVGGMFVPTNKPLPEPQPSQKTLKRLLLFCFIAGSVPRRRRGRTMVGSLPE